MGAGRGESAQGGALSISYFTPLRRYLTGPIVTVPRDDGAERDEAMTTPTIRITGNELAEIAAADITDQAAESAELLLSQGWTGGGASYDIGVYHGDRDALEARLGYEPTKEQLRDLETQIRAKLDEAVKIGRAHV